MFRSLFSTVALTCLVASCCNQSSADERDELAHKAAMIKREIAELRKNGHHDEAKILSKKAAELMEQVQLQEKHKPDNKEKELRMLREKLEHLEKAAAKAKEKNAEEELREVLSSAKRIRSEIASIESHRVAKEIPPQHRDRAEKLELMARRLRHMQVAAENLKAAEMHDMAHELMKKMENFERDLGQAKQELAAVIRESHEARQAGRQSTDPTDKSVLHRELESLRQELRKAHEELDHLRKERQTVK